MQMQHVSYFLALCEERSFTRAAKRCGVSQPSLTNAIMALEQELGGAPTQAPRRAHRARPRRPPLFPPDRRERCPCAPGRGGDGRRADVNVYAIAAVSCQLTMTPWSVM